MSWKKSEQFLFFTIFTICFSCFFKLKKTRGLLRVFTEKNPKTLLGAPELFCIQLVSACKKWGGGD
jgi:hypothetical protein